MKKFAMGFVIIVAILAVALTTRFYVMGEQSRAQANAGLENGQLQMCPDRPSCVCSLDEREQHAIAPFETSEKLSDPMQALADVIKTMKRTEVLEQKADYLHATFTSGLFRFVDDVEFHLVGDKIHVRSVSRVGYSDLGVNRKRVEAIRDAYNAKR